MYVIQGLSLSNASFKVCDISDLVYESSSGEAKVPDLDVVLAVDEDVDGLEVPVDHALGVDVDETLDNLSEHPPHLGRVLEQVVIDAVPQRLFVAELHLDVHEVKLTRS